MYTLVHPTRSRPKKSFDTISKWMAFAGQEVEVIISLDEDDPKLNEYYSAYHASPATILVQKNRSAIDAVNKAASVASGNIMIVVSDDFDCPKDWGSRLFLALRGRRDFVLKTYDGVQDYIVTLPILDQVYYKRYGYVYHPDYQHLFCDTEFTHVADVNRRLIVRNDITFLHRHHTVTKEKHDEVTKRAEATGRQGEKLYLQRCREKFGMPKNTDIMALCPEGLTHLQWLKKHGF